MTSTVSSEQKGKGNKTMYIVGGVAILAIIIVIVVVVVVMRKKSTTDDTGNTGNTGNTSNTNATALAASANLVTFYSVNYKYYLASPNNGTLVFYAHTSKTKKTSTDSGAAYTTTAPSANFYNNTYGSTNSLLTKYNIITNNTNVSGTDYSKSITVGGAGNIDQDFTSIIPSTSIVPTGFVVDNSFYAFAATTVSGSVALQSYVNAGTLVPVSIYGKAYGNGTVVPSNVIAKGNAATYSLTDGGGNTLVFPLLYTVYVTSNQTVVN